MKLRKMKRKNKNNYQCYNQKINLVKMEKKNQLIQNNKFNNLININF